MNQNRSDDQLKTLQALGEQIKGFNAASEDAGDALRYWYDKGPEERELCGDKGMEFVKNKNIGMDSGEMCNRFITSMDYTLDNFEQKKKYTMEVI